MADNVDFQTAALATPANATKVATDQLAGGEHVQLFKLMDGTADGSTRATVGANGLYVDVRASAAVALAAGAALIGSMKISDGVDTALVSAAGELLTDVSDRAGRALGIIASITAAVDVSDRDARLVGRIKNLDSAGAVIDPALKGQLPAALVGGRLDVNIGASGINFWQATQPVSLAAAVDVSDRAGRALGIVASITAAVDVSDRIGRLVGQVVGEVAHDAVDSGNPQKIGFFAHSTLPTAVASLDRVNALADVYGRLRTIQDRAKILGAWKAESGRLVVLAAAHAATAGFFWLINPLSSGVVCVVKKLMMTSVPTAVTAFPTAPRITCERMTFTGTASGAQITPAKTDTALAANVCTLRTASTGLTPTAGAVVTSFQVPPVLTGVGVAVPSEQYLYDSTDEDDYLILRAGEGLVFRQADAGTAADTRLAVLALSWEER